MASFASSSDHPFAPPFKFRFIFVNLPPMLRLVHNSMLYRLEDIVLSMKHETDLSVKEQEQARANDLFLEARKLCVDPKLSKSIINLCHVNPFFETIHDAAPNSVSEQSIRNVYPKICINCGTRDDLLATSCFHLLCVACVSTLWKQNADVTKKISCIYCYNDIEAEDVWPLYDTRSKIDIMVTLLKEDPTHKIVVFCEFIETLVRLYFALRSNNTKGYCCFDSMKGTINTHLIHQFQNKDDVNILLVDLRMMDNLESFNLSCVSKVYLMNACLKTMEQKIVSLFTKQKTNQVKFVSVLTENSVEDKLIGDKVEMDVFGISDEGADTIYPTIKFV